MNCKKTKLGNELANDIGSKYRGGVDNSFTRQMDVTEDARVEFFTDSVADMSNYNRRKRLKTILDQTYLLSFQIQSVINMVYRPSNIAVNKQVLRKTRLSNGRITSERAACSNQVSYGKSDIGVAVINDLLSGSGKTLSTMVACLYFAFERWGEVVERSEILMREQRCVNWATRVAGAARLKQLVGVNDVVVLASDKVVVQWEKASLMACSILQKSGVHLRRNPTRDVGEEEEEGINNVIQQQLPPRIHIFTSVVALKTYYTNVNTLVPCVVVDEYVVKGVHNLVTRLSDETPIFGRLILVSADASNTSEITWGSRKNSLIRNVSLTFESEGNCLKRDVHLSMALMSCSVLSSADKKKMVNYMIAGLNSVELVSYKIDIRTPLWGELTKNGFCAYNHLEFVGVKDVHTIATMGDLQFRLEQALVSADKNDKEFSKHCIVVLLSRLEDFKNGLLQGDNDFFCDICFQGFSAQEQVCILGPCFHIFCRKCMKTHTQTKLDCPKCRTDISGITDVFPVVETSDDVVQCPIIPDFKDVDDFLHECLGTNAKPFHPPGVVYACACVIASMLSEVSVKRILVTSPVNGFGSMIRKELGMVAKGSASLVHIEQLAVDGNKRKKTLMGYDEQMEWFKGNDGHGLKVLIVHEDFRSDGNGLLGLDLHEVDAVCSVGVEISGRRLGRLTRIPRVLGAGRKIVRLFSFIHTV